jgi:hypothetical protein
VSPAVLLEYHPKNQILTYLTPGSRLAAAPTSIGCSIFKEQALEFLHSLKAKGALYRPAKGGQGSVLTILATTVTFSGSESMLRLDTAETLQPKTGLAMREYAMEALISMPAWSASCKCPRPM